MRSFAHHISVFEHMSLIVGHVYNGVKFSTFYFESLQRYHTETNGLYFDLGFNRVKFKEYIGVIQVGNLTIEILPKADNQPATEESTLEWKKRLIDMLRAVGVFDIQAPSSSSLQIKNNSILDLYFELYIKELEYLLHRGLIKKYRKCESNLYTLKGTLLFPKHIQLNLVHQERSFVRHTVYDVQHELHCILYKALRLLKQINNETTLHSRIGSLLLHFPEMPDIMVSESTFQKLSFTRKTTHYQRAIEMARLLLLIYHPDISKGGNHVLALMFDMNLLWEQFVLVSLKKEFAAHHKDDHVLGQLSKSFWRPKEGSKVNIRPDIVIQTATGTSIVLDTKWKNLKGQNPSPEDLRQMFVYHHYYHAHKVAIIYPGENEKRKGLYFDKDGAEAKQECSLIGLQPEENIKEWQSRIFKSVEDWMTALKE